MSVNEKGVRRAQIVIEAFPDGRIGVKAGGTLSFTEVLAGLRIYEYKMLQKVTAGSGDTPIPGLNVRRMP
jgi:hypothetical protein